MGRQWRQSEETHDGQSGDQVGGRAPDESGSMPRCSKRRSPGQAFARSWTSIGGGKRRIGGSTRTVRPRRCPVASRQPTLPLPTQAEPAGREASTCLSGARFSPSSSSRQPPGLRRRPPEVPRRASWTYRAERHPLRFGVATDETRRLDWSPSVTRTCRRSWRSAKGSKAMAST